MASAAEQRVHPRHKLPVLIEAPGITDEWLRPGDISLGGCMIHVPDEPEMGSVSECAIRIEKKVFSGEVTVVWVREDLNVDPPEWNAGLWFKMPEEKVDEFEEAIEAVRASVGMEN